jgi:hypothetical protein
VAERRKRTIHITIFREHGGLYWIGEADLMKLAPNLEVDSSETLFVTVHASDCIEKSEVKK